MTSSPNNRQDAVEYLAGRGLAAEIRDWSMGRTVAVMAEPFEDSDSGVRLFRRVVWIVEGDVVSDWSVVDVRPRVGVLGYFSTLQAACDVATLALGSGWEDLDRASANLFEVEHVVEAQGRVYVLARVLDLGSTFEVGANSTLGGCRVEPWLDIPRTSGVHQRRDLFGFCLCSRADGRRFLPKARVVLRRP